MKISLKNLRSQKNATVLERYLQRPPTNAQVPEDLHDTIMSALRQQRSRPIPAWAQLGIPWVRWLATPAIAGCLAIGLLIYRANVPKPLNPSSASFAAPPSAISLGREMADSLPSTLTPLSDELTRVQQDLDRTRAFLVSSLP